MSIYFIQEFQNSSGLIKIGLSVNPEGRLKGMQVNSPVLLGILETLPGSDDVEAKLHEKFVRDRVRGEWFNASESLLNFIEEAIGWRMKSNRMSRDEQESSWREFYEEFVV